MCGIVGFNWEDKQNLKDSTNKIRHRGPDSKGYFTEKNLSLGHRRLSIIDLDKRSDQPMTYKDLTITFNGEIYNFKKIKENLEKKGLKFDTESDTEVLLKAYYIHGEKMLNLLEGMFTFAIYNKKNDEIFIARDRLGVKPLYYYQKEENFAFSSEIKSLLELKLDTNLDHESINKYFILRHMPKEGTPFKYIKKLKPGHYLKYKNKKLEVKKYWEFQVTETNLDFEKNKKILSELISESINKRLMSDVPLGVFLSGGLDSSAIVSFMHTQGIKDINTFTVNFGEKNSESKYAKIISEEFGTNHKEIDVNKSSIKLLPKVAYHLDEPLGDNAALSTYLMSKETSKHVKVILSGEGNDELFAGYQKYKLFKTKKYIPLKKIVFNQRLKDFLNKEHSKSYSEFTSVFNSKERSNLYKHSQETNFEDFKVDSSLNSILRFDIKNWLPNDLLLKNDKMTMAHSLEGRVPFLDHKLVEFAFSIPENQKLRFFKDKYIFREVIKKRIPKEIYQRKKQGFTIPLKSWIKEGIIDYSNDLINENNIDFLNKNTQLRIINNPTKNIFTKRQFWTLLMFNQWYKEYRDYLS